jgi:hypothetical protein
VCVLPLERGRFVLSAAAPGPGCGNYSTAQTPTPLKQTRRTRLRRHRGRIPHIRNIEVCCREEHRCGSIADGGCCTFLRCDRASVARVRLSLAGRDGVALLRPGTWCRSCWWLENGAEEAAVWCTRVWHCASKCVLHASWPNCSRPAPKQGAIFFIYMFRVPADTRFLTLQHLAATLACFLPKNRHSCTAQRTRVVPDA